MIRVLAIQLAFIGAVTPTAPDRASPDRIRDKPALDVITTWYGKEEDA